MNIFQSAEDNWPEDEAYGIISRWVEAKEDWTDEEIREEIEKDKKHFQKVFSSESDADDLMERFIISLEKYSKELGLFKN